MRNTKTVDLPQALDVRRINSVHTDPLQQSKSDSPAVSHQQSPTVEPTIGKKILSVTRSTIGRSINRAKRYKYRVHRAMRVNATWLRNWTTDARVLQRTDEAKQLKKLLREQMAASSAAESDDNDHWHKQHTPSSEFNKSVRLVHHYPLDVVREAMGRAIDKGNAQPAFVAKQLYQILDEKTPRFNFCSGGKTSIEINANGDYSRCSRLSARNDFLGNVLEEQTIQDYDLDKNARCTVACKRRMCFAANTIRAHTRESFDQQIATKGLRGDYRPQRENRKSDVFIRWKITEVCNYTCSYCTAWVTVNKKIKPEMPVNRILETARIFTNRFDNISLRITGGEPSVKKNYVELMQYLHANLDKFVEIEIRTNFSYPNKQKEIFAMDWQGKLHYHIGCHVYDKNFKPWEFVEILSKPTSVDYVLKFVATASNQRYVRAFEKYFIDNGIDPRNVRVVYDVMDEKLENSEEDTSDIPPAIVKMAKLGLLPDGFRIRLPDDNPRSKIPVAISTS